MFVVLTIMIVGVGVGVLLRRFQLKFLSKIISGFIFMLLFVLGTEVGGNSVIMDNLSTLGLEALVIACGALLGSLLAARFVYLKFFKGKDVLKLGGKEVENEG